jgi:hypothetical protein
VGIAVSIYLGSVLHDMEPDFYQPVRTALVTARQRIEQAYGHEATAIRELRLAHGELDAAITALNKAPVDPADQRKLETLQMRLQSLEDVGRLEHTSPEQLQQSYHDIISQLKALITRLESR